MELVSTSHHNMLLALVMNWLLTNCVQCDNQLLEKLVIITVRIRPKNNRETKPREYDFR